MNSYVELQRAFQEAPLGASFRVCLGHESIFIKFMPAFDDVVTVVHEIYSHLKFSPPKGQYTVLASFVLTDASFWRPAQTALKPGFKAISIGTGTKCLPAVKLPIRGEALHDSHAESQCARYREHAKPTPLLKSWRVVVPYGGSLKKSKE